jgi:hypothetical protein
VALSPTEGSQSYALATNYSLGRWVALELAKHGRAVRAAARSSDDLNSVERRHGGTFMGPGIAPSDHRLAAE